MRKAGEVAQQDPEVFETISKHLQSDGVPDRAADQMSAEMLNHGTDYDSKVDHYFRMFENYKSKGFDEDAAQAMAVEALEGNREEPSESLRFARVSG